MAVDRGALARRSVAGALLLAVLLTAARARAQEPIPETVRMMEPHRLRIGDRVRAWSTAAAPPLEGTIVAVGPTTLTVATPNDATLLTLRALDHMQVKRTRSHIRRAAAIGAGAGALASALLVTHEIFGRDIDGWERVEWTAGMVAGGAVLGTGVGVLTRSVTWQPVDLVTLKPQAAEMRPAVRVSWTVRF